MARRSDLRVLPLELWMTNPEEAFSYLTEIPPRFFRNGRYSILGESTWFEVGGRAFLEEDAKMFTYHLKRYDYVRLSKHEEAVLQSVKYLRLPSKILSGIREKLAQHSILQYERDNHLKVHKMMKRFKERTENG